MRRASCGQPSPAIAERICGLVIDRRVFSHASADFARSLMFVHIRSRLSTHRRGESMSSKSLARLAWACLIPFSVFAADAPAPAAAPPVEWIDTATGHRVVRLSTEAGTRSLYF